MVCYIQKARTHIALGFGQGARLEDPDGVLEGSGTVLRHVKITSHTCLDREGLKALVREAIALDRAG